MSVQRLMPGFVLSSRYRLLEQVAAGGMGAVWAATDVVLERKVAVKVMQPQTLEQQAMAGRFKAAAGKDRAHRSRTVTPGIADHQCH